MASYYTDTHPKMEALQIKLLRETPPWRKMEILAAMNKFASSLAMAGLRQRFPDADEAELHRHLADLILGPELARKIFED